MPDTLYNLISFSQQLYEAFITDPFYRGPTEAQKGYVACPGHTAFEPRSSGQKLSYYLPSSITWALGGRGEGRDQLRPHFGLQKCLPHTRTPGQTSPFLKSDWAGGGRRREKRRQRREEEGGNLSISVQARPSLKPHHHHHQGIPHPESTLTPMAARGTLPRCLLCPGARWTPPPPMPCPDQTEPTFAPTHHLVGTTMG